ncbi:2Fe-2S iron-sulfur cluster-binding protein [Devosia sp. Root635]|uniref:2Fe-2S iron-sulfur cluster-binding protein n=1 Tax=Devosia sp. Root635 TaxID=1736575 RepID=UPI0006F35FED|nr:2Fe-2S iron-sulfur cluster-binding protein [Devosia sp. Root635]KRA52978.1 hypothetical protein ASD80_14350 [Devosia sp. Root635]
MTSAGQTFLFDGMAIPFASNETIAMALDRAGIRTFGSGQGSSAGRYFCGIGACQACIVSVDGTRMEACLTPARKGLQVARIASVLP